MLIIAHMNEDKNVIAWTTLFIRSAISFTYK